MASLTSRSPALMPTPTSSEFLKRELARTNYDRLTQTTMQRQSIQTHLGAPSMVRDSAMLSVSWWFPCTWFVRRHESHMYGHCYWSIFRVAPGIETISREEVEMRQIIGAAAFVAIVFAAAPATGRDRLQGRDSARPVHTVGSFAAEMGCPPHVGFSPVGNRTADIAGAPDRAIGRHRSRCLRCQFIGCGSGNFHRPLTISSRGR